MDLTDNERCFDLRDLVWYLSEQMGTLPFQHHCSHSFAWNTPNHNILVPRMDALWGNKAISDGSGPHSYWESDMNRSAWGSKGSWDGAGGSSFGQEETVLNHNPHDHFICLDSCSDQGDKAVKKGDAFIIRLHMLKLYLSSQCVDIFPVIAQLHLRKQGSRKVKRSALSISNFALDGCISLCFISLHRLMAFQCCTQSNDTWTKQLTLDMLKQFNLFLLTRLSSINWRSKFYCTV